MKKKKWLLPLCIAAAVLLCVLFHMASGFTVSTGRCLMAEPTNCFMLIDDRPVRLNHKGKINFQTGDKLLVLHQNVYAESYPEQTRAYLILKTGSGSQDDVPQAAKDALIGAGIMAVPKDFSFSLTWNCYGVSSYDSKTGKLVKTTDATNPDNYVTSYNLTDAERTYIYQLLSKLDINSYPENYDPGNGLSKPSMTLILTVRADGTEQTIQAKNIALSYESDNEKGQAFLTACKTIRDILTATEEWNALPDYEYLYE